MRPPYRNVLIVTDEHVVRMSDAERNAVIERLSTAVAEGRLTMTEFEERVDAVVRARTRGDVEPLVADLPATVPAVVPQDVVELKSSGGQLRRTGRWAVPRRLVVRSPAGMVKLDLREAVISHPVVEIDLAAQAGSTTVVLPPGATADIDGVTTSGGTASLKVPSIPSSGPHFVITGSTAGGTLVVRYERRFWRWRY
jgi:hypothetical protein